MFGLDRIPSFVFFWLIFLLQDLCCGIFCVPRNCLPLNSKELYLAWLVQSQTEGSCSGGVFGDWGRNHGTQNILVWQKEN